MIPIRNNNPMVLGGILLGTIAVSYGIYCYQKEKNPMDTKTPKDLMEDMKKPKSE